MQEQETKTNSPIKLWLDDVRNPVIFERIGWTWVKTAQQAIDLLKEGNVEKASLDHDLAEEHYPWNCEDITKCKDTGYDVVCWMEENNVWPPLGVTVHSMNPVGRQRMEQVIRKAYDNRRSK